MSWLSLPEYARLTGTPESSVRALIRAGKLEAHREARAPGDPREVWKILVDDPSEPSAEPSAGHPQTSTAIEADQPQPATTESPALTTSLLEMVKADRETIAAQAETIAELRERVGRAEAEAAARADALEWTDQRRATAEAELRRLRALAERPWWRKLFGAPPA